MRFLKEQPPFGDTQGDYTFNGSATAGKYLGPSGQILSTPGNEFTDFMLGAGVFVYPTASVTCACLHYE
jgi:hypothetical protein